MCFISDVRELKNNFNHIYLSTGATYNAEIKEAARILKKNFTLLHCVTQYPNQLNNLNLSRMKFLNKYSCVSRRPAVSFRQDESKCHQVQVFLITVSGECSRQPFKTPLPTPLEHLITSSVWGSRLR